jgi:hypothetical protein
VVANQPFAEWERELYAAPPGSALRAALWNLASAALNVVAAGLVAACGATFRASEALTRRAAGV